MLSLIRKDVAAVRRALLWVIPFGALQLAVFASVGPVFLAAALLFSAVLAFGSIPVEEAQRTEVLWNSLPVRRGEIVVARYLAALLGILAGLAVSMAVGRLTTSLMAPGATSPPLFVSLPMHAFLFVILTLAASVFLPFYFRFGAGRGLLISSTVGVGALLIVAVLVQVGLSVSGQADLLSNPETWAEGSTALRANVAAWLEPRAGWILGLLAGLSTGAMAVSALVSCGLYSTRDL